MEGYEQEVIIWLQAFNPTPGVKRAYFHKPELWIYSADGSTKRPAVTDQKFSKIGRHSNWDGSNYPAADGPVGNTTPTNERFDVRPWQANAEGVVTVTAKAHNHYYDLWHVRFKMKKDEYVTAAVNAQTEGDLRVRLGVDFWARDPVTGKDTTNRGVKTNWVTPQDQWTKIRFPEQM